MQHLYDEVIHRDNLVMTNNIVKGQKFMEVIRKAQLAKEVLSQWQNLESSRKNQVLNRMADLLLANTDDILQANAQDVLAAKDQGISTALLDRLTLTATRVQDMAAGLKDVALLPDPVGQVISGTVRPNGLRIENIRVPLGLVAMIYEARPNVTADAAGLCLKAGNGVILRGGSGAINSNKQIVSFVTTSFRGRKSFTRDLTNY